MAAPLAQVNLNLPAGTNLYGVSRPPAPANPPTVDDVCRATKFVDRLLRQSCATNIPASTLAAAILYQNEVVAARQLSLALVAAGPGLGPAHGLAPGPGPGPDPAPAGPPASIALVGANILAQIQAQLLQIIQGQDAANRKLSRIDNHLSSIVNNLSIVTNSVHGTGYGPPFIEVPFQDDLAHTS